MTLTKDSIDVRGLLPDGMQLINGELVPAKSGQTIEVVDPSNQELILRVARGAREDVDAAVASATEALWGWSHMNPEDRSRLLRKWGELIGQHAENIAVLDAMEVGSPVKGSRRAFARMPNTLDYYAGLADKIQGNSFTPPANQQFVGITFREPYGVCAIIVPWNAPGVLMMRDAVPALAAGNTLVVKPSSDAPLACTYIAKLAQEAGFPPGVINVVNGRGSEAGDALASHPGLNHMCFTGSTTTGTSVMKACADNLTPVLMELGGKSPQIVFNDANLGHAVPAIVGSIIARAGQICYAGTRVLVEDGIRQRLVDAVAEAFKKVRVGMWYEDVDMGPVINAGQERQVLGYLDSGREEGAQTVVGGHKMTDSKYAKGFFIEPTLFDQVKPTMRIAKEEIFGPVLSVLTFKDLDEALEIANDTPYGLAASIWTDSLHRAVSLAREIKAGQVLINNFNAGSSMGGPFGGYKHSGFGRAGGTEAILSFTQLKSVIINPLDPEA